MNITPENITHLAPDEVFVYGANEGYVHGAGAAKTALKWGAKHGYPSYQGQTYGIPTKTKKFQILSIKQISMYVDTFTLFAKQNPKLKLLITEIGCGLSRYEPEDIAPLFLEASKLPNVWLSQRFWHVLNNK